MSDKTYRIIRNMKADYSHYIPEANALGSHDTHLFNPYRSDLRLRCPHCHNMLATSWTQVGTCPTCHAPMTKMQWSDIFVESLNIERWGGWEANREFMEAVKTRPPGSYYRFKTWIKEVDQEERNRAAVYRIEQERRQNATRTLNEHLRKNSALAELM